MHVCPVTQELLSRFQLTRQRIGLLAKDSSRVAPLYANLFWRSLAANLAFLIRRRSRPDPWASSLF